MTFLELGALPICPAQAFGDGSMPRPVVEDFAAYPSKILKLRAQSRITTDGGDPNVDFGSIGLGQGDDATDAVQISLADVLKPKVNKQGKPIKGLRNVRDDRANENFHILDLDGSAKIVEKIRCGSKQMAQ